MVILLILVKRHSVQSWPWLGAWSNTSEHASRGPDGNNRLVTRQSAREGATGASTRIGVVTPRVEGLYAWSAGELKAPSLRQLLSGQTPCYAALPGLLPVAGQGGPALWSWGFVRLISRRAGFGGQGDGGNRDPVEDLGGEPRRLEVGHEVRV